MNSARRPPSVVVLDGVEQRPQSSPKVLKILGFDDDAALPLRVDPPRKPSPKEGKALLRAALCCNGGGSPVHSPVSTPRRGSVLFVSLDDSEAVAREEAVRGRIVERDY